MKKRKYLILIFSTALLTLAGCSKKDNQNTAYIPTAGGGSSGILSTTADPNAPKVEINNIVSYAGEEIDYLSNIETAENMELSKSMIYVDSSGVDLFTPGTYTAIYTFDYMGTNVIKEITVTIKENPRTSESVSSTAPSSETVSEQNTSVSDTEQTTSNRESSETTSPENASGSSESNLPSIEPLPESPTGETASVQVSLSDQEIPDASITLSTGKVVTIKCTPSRYIVETFTEESYFEEYGNTYLNSQLKLLYNTGEVQVVETVITRVQPQPETAAEPETT